MKTKCNHCKTVFSDRIAEYGYCPQCGERALKTIEKESERGVRGREEIREKLEEAKGEGVGLYSDVANHMIRVTLEWVLKQQDSLEESVLGVRDEL